MVKDESKLKDNECPKCHFAGTDSDTSKFSVEQINQYPKGYAPEKHPQIITNTKSGQQTQQFVIDKKTKEIIFDEIKRCPIDGYVEGDEL